VWFDGCALYKVDVEGNEREVLDEAKATIHATGR
jgi:hypothetical protein